MTERKAIIFDIQRNSYVDGPGIRTTVFFKGCNLRCAWCHNPESQSPHAETMLSSKQPRVCGKEYTVDEILQIVCKDKRFYESSGGGVTFSGGECILQIDYLTEILKRCKENGIHTAVDTAGHVPFAYFERILPYTDLFLYDVKCSSDETHKRYTGVGNAQILENLKALLSRSVPIWVRIPIIPTVNDTVEEMQAIKSILSTCGRPEKIELLPYHALGEHKYQDLGREHLPFSVPDDDKISCLKQILTE